MMLVIPEIAMIPKRKRWPIIEGMGEDDRLVGVDILAQEIERRRATFNSWYFQIQEEFWGEDPS